MSTVRFQADNDFNRIILHAFLRREPALDVQTAIAAGLTGRPDPDVLAIAAGEGRVLLTHDKRTIPQHFADFISTQSSPGVFIVVQKANLNAIVEDLLLIWSASDAEEWVNCICVLPL